MAKKKRELSDAQYQKMYGRPKNTSNKAGTNTKSQSSVSNKKTSKPISSGFTVGYRSPKANANNTSRSTSTSRNVTSQDRVNQKSYGATRRGVAPTATSRQRNTPATSAEMRRQNAAANNNLKQTQAERSRTEQKQRFNTAKEMMSARRQTNEQVKAQNAKEWEGVKNTSKEEQQAWFTKKAQEAQQRHTGRVEKGTDNLATSAAKSAFHGAKGAVHSLYGALTRASLQVENETQRDMALAALRGEDVNQAEAVAREKAKKRQDLKLAGIRAKTKAEQEKVEEIKEAEAAKDKGPIPFRKWTVGAASLTGQRVVDTALLGPYSLASMGARVLEDERNAGQEKNERLKKRLMESGNFTQEELDREFDRIDRRSVANAYASSGIEILSELTFGGFGLSKQYIPKGASGLLDKTVGKLFGNIGKSVAGQMVLGNLEEAAEEWWANPAQSGVSNFLTGNRLQALQEESVRREYQKQAMDLKEMQATSADINSDAFLERAKEIYKESGATDKEASKIAELARDYFNADIIGDSDTAEAKLSEITNILAGGENDLREKWTLKDAIDVTGEIFISGGAEGFAGAISSSATGNAYKGKYGVEGVRKLAKVVENLDADKSDRAKAIIDDIDNGKDITGTQVSQIMEWSNETALKAQDREITRDNLVQNRMKDEKLFVPIVDSEYNLSPATDARFEEISDRVVDSIDNMGIKMSDVDAYAIADVVAAYETGTISAEQMNELNVENPEARAVFERETGINLDQYTVKDKRGNIKVAESNIKMQKALFSNAADNYMASARIEQENWNNVERGRAAESLTSDMDGMGGVGIQRVLESVDPRNRGDFMLAGSVARRVYDHARLTNDSWEDVRKDFKNAFPGATMDESMRYVYDMAKRTKAIAETQYYGKQVSNKQSLADSETMYVPGNFTNNSERMLGNTELSTLTNMATTLGVNIVMSDNMANKNANGSYDSSTRTITLNADKSMGEMLQFVLAHEVTHHLAAYAPDEYLKLSRFVMDKAYKADAEKFEAAIKNIQKKYKDQAKQDLTPEQALEEIIADNAHEFWQDEAFINDVTSEEPTLAQSIINAIKDILNKLRRVLASGNITDENDRQFLFDEIDSYDQTYKLWMNAFRVARDSQANQAIDNWQDDVNADLSLADYEANERFSIVEDKDLIKQLEADEHRTSYRAMVQIDGKLYPPMSTQVRDEEGNWGLQQGIKIGQWVEADATTDSKMFNAKGQYMLRKDNGKTVPAAYNPYIHSSDTMLNDQFASAYQRPNMVVVEGVVPESELTNGVPAETELDDGRTIRAKDAPGVVDWKAGVVQGKLTGTRTVYLTNHFKPTRVVPDSEVAENIRDMVEDTNVAIPYNVVTPSVRNELANLGVNMEQSSNPRYQVRFSISAQQDADYMKAVESGDMETAQRMVDEAAKSAGFVIKGWHGTDAKFNSFDTQYIGSDNKLGKGFYFSRNGLKFNYPTEISAWLKVENPITDRSKDISDKKWDLFCEAIGIAPVYGVNDLDKYTRASDIYKGDNDAFLYEFIRITGKDGIISDDRNSIVLFSPINIKSANSVTYAEDGSVIPLSERFNQENPDFRFSISAPVERVRDLVAVHNLNEEDLRGDFGLGGFPMPSIAVTKSDVGHDRYGSISLLFHSDTIDPKTNRNNQIFGGDAWTPTFPPISKKYNTSVLNSIDKTLHDIIGLSSSKELPGNLRFPSLDEDNVANKLDYNTPYEAYGRDEVFRLAYIMSQKGYNGFIPTKESELYGENRNTWEIIDDRLPEITYDDIYDTTDHTMQYEPALRNALYDSIMVKDGDVSEETRKKIADHLYKDELPYNKTMRYLENLIKFRKEGIPDTVDSEAFDKILNEQVDEEGFKSWIDGLFDGYVEKTGMRNDKDLFTPSGNRRSWESLHDPVTLDNVVRIMKNELDAGGTTLFGANPKGAAQKVYKSLDDVRADKDRLQSMSEEEFESLSDSAMNKLSDVCDSIVKHNPKVFKPGSFGASFDVGSNIAEVLNRTKDRDRMQQILKKDYWLDVTDDDMDLLMEAIEEIANLPTEYFEAKPRRAVGFNEVKAAIVPEDTSEDVLNELELMEIPVTKYNKEVEGDRAAKLNEVADAEQLKFSLSPEQRKLDDDYMAAVTNYQKLYDADDIGWIKAENEIAKMVDQAAFNAGYATKAYHGTPSEPFNVFNRDYVEHGRLHGDGFYFSPYEDIANQYGETRAYYLKTGLLNEEDLLSDKWLGAQDYKDFTSIDEALAFYEEKQEEYEKYGQGMARFRPDVAMANGRYRVLYTTVGVFDQGLILVAMEPEYAKFAEPITYAEDGSVIPLSQRFNSDNQDMRYSLPTSDAEGTALSNGQIEFFEQSKVRNGAGQLKVMLHGTDADFTEFDPSKARPGTLGRAFYFSDSDAHAGQYGNVGRYYLNLEHPLMGDTHDITKDQLRKFVAYLADNEDYGIENYGADSTVDSVTDSVWGGTDFAMLRDLNLSAVGDFAEAVKVFNRVNGTDYDGIITDVETAAFYPEQIKRTDNLNPTLNKDTRYSITDADGKTLSDGQVKYFRNSQARDEQGRLVRVFHSTDKGGFTIFDPSYSDDKRSIFFTSNYRMSRSYVKYKDESRTFNAMEFGLPEIEPHSIMDMQDVVDYLASLTDSQKDQFHLVIYADDGMSYDSWTPAGKNASIEAFFEKYGDDFKDIEGYIEDIDSTIGNFSDKDELFNELEECVKYINDSYGENNKDDSGTYECYLNLENPMIIDCKGSNWDSIREEGFEHIYVRTLQGDLDDPSDLIYYITDEYMGIGKKYESIEEIREDYGDGFADQIAEIDEAYNGQQEFFTWDGASFNPEEEGYWPEEGNTRYWCLEAEARGYDGVIFLNLADNGPYGNGYETGDVYVAFNSNQVKDVNNLNPTENPDIRYSIPPEDEVKSKMAYEYAMDDSYEALEYYEQRLADLTEEAAENRPIKIFSEEKISEFYAGLRSADSWVHTDPIEEEDAVRMAKSKNDFFANLNAKWNDRWTTGGEVLNVKSVKSDVRNLVMGVMQNSDTDSLYKNDLVKKTLFDVRTAFQLMKQDRPEVASELLYYSAQRMIDNVQFYEDSTFDQYKNLKHYLRNTRISLGEEYWSDVDYDAFRKNNFGRLKLVKGNTNVDQVYQELEKNYPEFFNEEEVTSVPDQLLQIEHVLDSVQPYKEAYSSEEAAELAFDIADDLYEIMVNGDEVRSLADTYKARYDAKTKAMKLRHAEALLRVRKARDEGIQAERQKFREYKERQKATRDHRKHYQRIQKNYDWLVQRILDPTKDKNVPEEFRQSLAEMLQTLDMQTENSKKLEAKTGHVAYKTFKMRELKDRLNEMATRKGDNGVTIFELDANVGYLMDSLVTKLDGQSVDALDATTISEIDTVLAAIRGAMVRHNKIRIENKSQEISEIAGEITEDFLKQVEKRGKAKKYEGIRGGINAINTSELTPVYFFERLGKFNVMYNEVRYGGFDTYVRNEKHIIERMEEITKPYFNKGKIRKRRPKPGSELDKWRDSRSAQTFNLTNGSITLTTAQMMSLYCLSKREQAMKHMYSENGGIVATPIEAGTKQQKIKEKLKGKEETNEKLIVNETDIQTIIAALTPEQINVADQLQQLMANDMADLGNEAHREMYGYNVFEEQDYFPIKVHGNEIATDINDIGDVIQKIKSFGPAKPLDPHADNLIEIDDIFSVTVEHCNGMNLYNAFLVPISDFMRVYNYKQRFDDGKKAITVKDALETAHGKKALDYIVNFMKDINGIKPDNRGGLEGVLNKALGTAKKTAVFGNIRVALQQPTAIVRAAAEIDGKHLIPFIKLRAKKGIIEEMKNYCPIAYWKSLGYYDAYMGRDLEDTVMNNWSMGDAFLSDVYGLLDIGTWSLIWQAVKSEQAEAHPEMDTKSEEFLQMCGRRASEVFDKTQVVDSTFHRSDAMRSNQIAIKSLTAFMSEPTLTLNVFRAGWQKAIDQWQDGDKSKAAGTFRKTMSVIIMQAALVSLAQAIADAWRGKDPGDLFGGGDDDDDEPDEDFKIRLIHNLTYNFFDNLHLENNIYIVKDAMPLFNFMMSKAGDYYGWNDTFRAIMGWDQKMLYSNGNLIYAGGENIVQGVAQIYKKLEDGDDYEKDWYDIIQRTASGVGTFVGVPAGTLMRDFKPLLDKVFENAFAADGSDVDDTEYSETVVDKVMKHLGYRRKDRGEREEAKKQKDFEKERKKIKESVMDLKGEEKAKKTWSKVTTYIKEAEGKSMTDLIAEGDYSTIDKYRTMYEAAGLDSSYFDERVFKASKNALKKSISYDMTDDEMYAQQEQKAYLRMNGMTDEEISKMAYKSDIARDVKVAMMLGDEELVMEAVMPLVQAGLSQEDFNKLWENRNHIDLKKYDGRYKDKLKSTGNYVFPADGIITSDFGHRSSPGGIGSTNHQGLDIAGPQGTPIQAADGGVVVMAGWYGGYGKTVQIKHDDGTITQYSHLDWWDVNEGDVVGQGQEVGLMGSTGNSTGSHLHFGVIKNGEYVDPKEYINTYDREWNLDA